MREKKRQIQTDRRIKRQTGKPRTRAEEGRLADTRRPTRVKTKTNKNTKINYRSAGENKDGKIGGRKLAPG